MTDESNNVIDFSSRRVLKQAEPAIKEIAGFRHFYDDHMDGVQYFVDNLLFDMADYFGFDPDHEVLDKDYTLLIESAMSLVMRVHGINHPLCTDFANTFVDRPKE